MTQIIIPPMRDQVIALEAEIKKLPQIEIPVKHYFSHGLYAREISVPESALIVGVIHKQPQINILSKGCLLLTVDEDVRQVYAPYTVVSPPGVKRAAMAMTDCVWTTIVHTFLTDVEQIEKEFFAYSEEEYRDYVKEQADYKWLE